MVDAFLSRDLLVSLSPKSSGATSPSRIDGGVNNGNPISGSSIGYPSNNTLIE